MPNADPNIALVVKTRNRGARLEPFFSAIQRLENTGPWELIIVDNGSTDDTATRLKAFAAQFHGMIKIVSEPRRGAGFACNAGWRAATAPIIAFTDDDCYPKPDYLRNIQAVFADPCLGFMGGRILLYDPSDAPVTICESQEEHLIYPHSFVWAGFIHGANMAFRRQILLNIDGFDNAFGPGTPFVCEEADLALRALASGCCGKYDPRPVVYHHHGRKQGEDVELLSRIYDAGRGAYYMKCLLYLPQRWQCAWHWVRCMRRQSPAKTLREIQSAIRYFFHQFNHKPNRSY